MKQHSFFGSLFDVNKDNKLDIFESYMDCRLFEELFIKKDEDKSKSRSNYYSNDKDD